MKRLVLLCALVFSIFGYGIFLSQYNISILTNILKIDNAPGYYDYKGVTHCHTSLNRGSSSPEQVIAAAEEAKLDFLFLTDLNYFGTYPDVDKYFGNVLIFPGSLISYLDHDILNYNNSELRNLKGLGEAQVVISDLLSKKNKENKSAFLVLAHPFKNSAEIQLPLPLGFDGLEVINLKTIWKKAWTEAKLSFFWSIFVYPFNPNLALIRLFEPPLEEIKLWDQQNSTRVVTGYVGNETTSRFLPVGESFLRFPTYKNSFEIATNHILLKSELTGIAENDRKKILSALKLGQFYMSLDILANPKGFFAEMSDEKQVYSIGQSVPLGKNLKLKIVLPQKPTVPFEVSIIRNGKSISTSSSRTTTYLINQPGVYRVLVRVIPTFPLPDGKRWIPWIYTNTFQVSQSA